MTATDLGTFDGKDVLNTGIAVTNAGDGLSDAMKVDPTLLHLGDKVYVVLECQVSKINFVPIKDTDAVSRVHTLKAGTATMVDADLVAAQLQEQAERIQLAKEAEAGIQRLPQYDTDQLVAGHEAGDHAEALVDGCPECQAEVDQADGEGELAEPTPIAGGD